MTSHAFLKPTIITMVAIAAGIESLRMSQVRLREISDQRRKWNFVRSRSARATSLAYRGSLRR